MENVKKKRIEVLVEIEKRESFNKGLRTGFIYCTGIIIVFIIILIVSIYMNRQTLQSKLMDTVISSTFEKIFTSFPDAYFTNNSKHITEVLDNFTNAAAAHRITKSDYNRIAKRMIHYLRDRRLTYAELTDLVNLIDESAKSK